MLEQSANESRWTFQAAVRQTDLDEFQKSLEQFSSRAISEAQFRAIRVPMGIYEQRESGTYMLRVRFPAGGVLPEHLRCLGETSNAFGNGVLHVTTRQEFQIHRVPLNSIMPALRRLAEAGLSTKGGGGNTLRNVTACCDSGVCRDEIFDIVPYAVSVTERLLADPVSLQLPRKCKIAFAGCARDCSGATVNDVGFIARRQNGSDGFAVYVAGGMGGKSRIANLLHEFIPAADAYIVAEAIKRVFDQHGDRKNKHLARLRFLIEKIGLDKFRELYRKELTAIRASAPASLQIRPCPRRERASVKSENTVTNGESHSLSRWRKTNLSPQKQPGLLMVHVPLALGDLSAEKATALAETIELHGERYLWATQSQNLVLRGVTEPELPALHEKLEAIGLATPEPPVLRNLVACAGASTCRLGICLSRGLAKAVRQELTASHLALEKLGDLSVHISGCPNSCGRHPVGNIGLSGAARRIDGQLVPFYAVQLGGRVGEGKTRFGTNVGAIPARNVPAFVRELLAAWQQSSEAADFHRFVDRDGKNVATELVRGHQELPTDRQDRKFFQDWDATAAFSLAGRGAGECSAGVFDLIEVNLANARESLEAGQLYAATLSASRALLVTRNAKPQNDQETFELFQKHFISEGLLDSPLAGVAKAGIKAAQSLNPAKEFSGKESDVTTLVASVRLLYESMDSSLRFKAPSAAKPQRAKTNAKLYQGIEHHVGKTPLIRLNRLSDLTGCEILGKAEFMNPGGSVKDRAALGIIADAEAKGLLKPGDTIVEGTAGNTGIGLAVIGHAKGYRVVIVIPQTQSPEKINLLRSLGAEVITVPEKPYSEPGNYNRVAQRLAQEKGWFWADQFDNTANRLAHYRSTGPEIWEQTSGNVTAFVSAVGTGGTLAGTSLLLKEKNPDIKIVCADPFGAAMWSWFTHGHLNIKDGDSEAEGIGQTRVTKNLQDISVDRAYRIPDQEAVTIVYQLLREEGLFLGLSSGINIAGAVRLARELGPNQTIVTPLCDSGAKYQSKFFNKDWLAAHQLDPNRSIESVLV